MPDLASPVWLYLAIGLSLAFLSSAAAWILFWSREHSEWTGDRDRLDALRDLPEER